MKKIIWVAKALAALCLVCPSFRLAVARDDAATIETIGAALSRSGVPKHMLDWAEANDKPKPTAVRTALAVTETGVRATETFVFPADAGEVWAALPSGFALAQVMGGPVQVDGPARDVGVSGPFGPLVVLEGSDTIAYTVSIPGLKDYLFDRPAWTNAPKDSPFYNALRDRLREEIDKILTLGREGMAPFVHRGTGSNPTLQWNSPAETIIALCWALPFLEPARQEALRGYIREFYEKYDPLVFTAIEPSVGARREYYDIRPVDARIGRAALGRDMHGLYAVWQYVESVAGANAAKDVLPAIRSFLNAEMNFNWDAGENTGTFRARGVIWSTMNNRINGYIGAARLARLADDTATEQLAVALLARAAAVRVGQAHFHQWLIRSEHPDAFKQFEHSLRGLVHVPQGAFGQPEGWMANQLPLVEGGGLHFSAGFRRMDLPYVFLNELTPELGQLLHDHARTPIETAARYIMWKVPGCWLMRGPKDFRAGQGEDWVPQPYFGWITFMTLATVLREPPEELAWYVGDSVARFGDMFYLQRLAMALRAFAVQQ